MYFNWNLQLGRRGSLLNCLAPVIGTWRVRDNGCDGIPQRIAGSRPLTLLDSPPRRTPWTSGPQHGNIDDLMGFP